MKKLHVLLMCSLVFKLVKREPLSLTRSLISKLVKKTRWGLNSLSCFQAHEKETQPGLFFNLRLRKASKPLRERV